MKKALKISIILISITLTFSACGENTRLATPSESTEAPAMSSEGQPVPLIDCTNLDLLENVYLKPLGLTRVIGVPWSSPAELDSDDILTTYEIKMIGNPILREKYLADYQYLYPAEDVEDYTSAYFGMTAEQTRKYSGYDDDKKVYVVDMGLGGAWGAYVINAQQEEDILHLEYCIVNSYSQTAAYGVIDIRIWADGSYQYLSNRQEDLQIPSPTDDGFAYPDPITETANGTVVLNLSGNGQTKMTYAAGFTAKANQSLELEITGDWQGGAVNLFLLSPDKQFTTIRITKNYYDTVLLSGGEWNYNCTGIWQSGDVSIIARLKDKVD